MRVGVLACVVAILFGSATAVAGEEGDDTVTIQYADEVPLEGVIEYAARRLNIRILYGDELQDKIVRLKPSPVSLPRARLLDLVRSMLRIHDLVLIEQELDGFHRIVKRQDAQRNTGAVRTPAEASLKSGSRVVTQAIRIASGDTKAIAPHLKSFLSSEQASLIEAPEAGLIIVTDFEEVIARLMRLVDLIDVPQSHRESLILPVKLADPILLAEQIERINTELESDVKVADRGQVLADIVPGSLVIVGSDVQIERIRSLAKRLDVRREHTIPTRAYVPQFISASRLQMLIEKLVTAEMGSDASTKLFTDEPTNRVYVTGPPAVHLRISSLIEELDAPLPESVRPMRIYRPRNRSAAEILETLTQLLEEATVSVFTQQTAKSSDQPRVPPGRNRAPVLSGNRQLPPTPPAQEPIAEERIQMRPGLRVEGPGYVLTEDEHTNSIIAIGTPEFHSQLDQLINELDRRRPQVFIEMTLVAVSLSDSLDFGVELESLDLGGGGLDFLSFTNFGLSTIDVSTGQRILTPGIGANGVIIGPEEVHLVLRALATNGKNRVISTPKIVVSDNATGTIRSVEEAPFTSVNASDTVATTSFAGFESAGTTLTVTPRITEGDHITLDYNLNFSNFTGAASDATAPPPRTTNSFTSRVEVPNGYTVVVGGLIIENDSDTSSEVPFLGRIPVLGLAFQSSSTSRTRSKIFAFIRPVVLKDDQFRDLKFYSDVHLKEAGLENPDYPPDRLMWMH